MVLASVGIIDGTPQPRVSHPRTSQVPKSKNHIQSIVPSTVTDFDIPDYPQPPKLATPPRHPPRQEVEEPLPVLPTNLRKLSPNGKQVILDGFISIQATPIHTHKGTLAYTP
jgi:hypothetical protein